MMPTSGARPLSTHYFTSLVLFVPFLGGFALHILLPPNAQFFIRIKRRNNRCDSVGTLISPILCALDVPLTEKVWHDLKFIRSKKNPETGGMASDANQTSSLTGLSVC